MIINKSLALKAFKKEVGQANHMLITILVGLDGVAGKDLEINKEFHAAWNPKDKVASALRGREFAQKSCLAWMVDCLDMYLRLINKRPSIISDADLKRSMDAEDNSRSVHKRLVLVCDKYQIDEVRIMLASAMICWRNRLTHYDADNDLSAMERQTLIENKDAIKNDYRGLDIESMLRSLDEKRSPKFKEVASLVSASSNLVCAIDASLLADLDILKYADQVLVNFIRRDKVKTLNKIFSNEPSKIEKSLRQILMQYGFAASDTQDSIDKLCGDLSKRSFEEIKMRFEAGTFI